MGAGLFAVADAMDDGELAVVVERDEVAQAGVKSGEGVAEVDRAGEVGIGGGLAGHDGRGVGCRDKEGGAVGGVVGGIAPGNDGVEAVVTAAQEDEEHLARAGRDGARGEGAEHERRQVERGGGGGAESGAQSAIEQAAAGDEVHGGQGSGWAAGRIIVPGTAGGRGERQPSPGRDRRRSAPRDRARRRERNRVCRRHSR